MSEQRIAAIKLLAIAFLAVAMVAVVVRIGGCPPLLGHTRIDGCCMTLPTNCGPARVTMAGVAVAALAASVGTWVWLRRRLAAERR